MVLKPDQTMWVCGLNNKGQLCDGTTINRNALLKITDGIKAVSGGDNYTMVIKSDNSLWACGQNDYGQLGDGTTIDRTSLVKIADGVKAVKVQDCRIP